MQDSLVLDGHLYGPLLVLINEDKYQSLSKAEQEALVKGAEAFCTVHAGITAASEDAELKDMMAKGLKVHQPSADEQKMFREAAQPAAVQVIAKKIGQEWVDRALKAAQDANAAVAGSEQQRVEECRRQAQDMLAVARGK